MEGGSTFGHSLDQTERSSGEQWKKGPWLLRVYRGSYYPVIGMICLVMGFPGKVWGNMWRRGDFCLSNVQAATIRLMNQKT